MKRIKLKPDRSFLIYRSQILAGKSFNVLAIMYSEDPESAKNGGEIGFLHKRRT